VVAVDAMEGAVDMKFLQRISEDIFGTFPIASPFRHRQHHLQDQGRSYAAYLEL